MKKKALLVLMALIVMIVSISGLVACFGDDGGDDVVEKPEDKYTVTFMAEGITIGTQTYTEKNKDITEPAVPNKDGYTGAWEEYKLTKGDKTVNAVYTAIEYTLTFVADGETVGSDTYTVEDKNITAPEVPNKVGYKGVWEEYELTTGDTTVNAVYTIIEYTVTFVADGETVGTATYTVEDKEITEPTVPSKDYYTGAWEEYELTTGDKTVNAEYTAIEYTVTFVADGETVGTATYTVEDKDITAPEVPNKVGYKGAWEKYELTTGDKTVNAVYTAIEYTVTFVADGVTVDTVTYTVEDKDITAPEVPNKVGYKSEWEEYELTTGDKTVNAVYYELYTVTFVADGKTVGTATYTVEDKNISAPEVPKKDGYTGAWEKYELTTGDITINAVYTAIEYTVTFVADGETVGTATYTVEDKDITEPAVPKKSGYTDAWEEYELTTGDKTVNAVYTAIEYTVTFVADGVTVGTATYTVEDKKITAPEVPNKDYYTSAWEKYELTTGDITVNAVYTAIEYTVTFVADGETVGTATYTVEDKEITAPEVPNKDYYTGVWEEYVLTTGDKTIYAVYTEIYTKGLKFKLSNGSYTVVDYTGTETEIYIPSTYEGCPVTSIGEEAFAGCSSLISIEIPSSVTSIGSYAFYNCSSIESIEIPASVTSIGFSAFSGCRSLISIEIPEGVTSIGFNAFDGCSSLVSVKIPEGVTIIDYRAFRGCSSLVSIEIPASVKSIGSEAFSGCSRLASIEIPEGVTSIGSEAFSGCSRLASIEIPDSVTSIGFSAFSKCSSLTSIEIPNSVTSINRSAFSGCSRLEGVYIEDIVAWCGIWFGDKPANPLYYAKRLYINNELATEIVIPNTVTSISSYAFYNCSSLENIYCEAGSKPYSWEDNWNSNCSASVKWGYNNETSNAKYDYVVKDNKVYLTKYKGEETEIVIPKEIEGKPVVSIGSIFSGNKSIKTIEIPNSVTSIGSGAFEDCSSLESIEVGVGNTNYSSQDGILYNKEKTRFIHIPKSIKGAVVIPNSITSIGSNAFSGCSRLKSVEIPSSVTSIGGSAFEGCSNLEGVYIEDIAAWCGIEFGDSSANPLYYANRLYINNELATEIVIPNTVTSIGSDAFWGCSSLASIEIPSSVTSIGDYAFSECSSLASIKIPEGLTSIGSRAFSGCSSLESIEIPDSVTNIDSSAFYGCDKLIQKENGVHYVDKWVIDCDTSVTNAILRANTVGIGSMAFYGCSSIESIEIPDSVTYIGGSAFYECNSLASIEIPDSVTSIGRSAFSRCSSLTSIVIPASVTSIGEYAFYECSRLTSIEYSGTKAEWKAIEKGFCWNDSTGAYTVKCSDGTLTKA